VGKINGRIKLPKNTMAIPFTTFPEMMAILNILKLYFVAPAIMGIESPIIGIHGEMKSITQPYFFSKEALVPSFFLSGFFLTLFKNLMITGCL
jgi:hypothetical protein